MSDAQINDKLQLIINKFLCCVPVNDIDLTDCLSTISWSDQAILINQTVNNKIVKIYPIKTSYQRTFLKHVINILEKNYVEIHDNLYDTYCNLLSVEDKEKYYYKHYNIDKKIITLKENKNFISEGTTGLCSWQASLALSQWCLNNKQFLEKRTILELGSGVGLVGLTTILHCQPEAFYLTDCHPKVLSILTENVQFNIGAKCCHEKRKNNQLNKIIARSLDTTKHTPETRGSSAADFTTKSNTTENCTTKSNTTKKCTTTKKCSTESNTTKDYTIKSNTTKNCTTWSNTTKKCTTESNTTDGINRVGDISCGSHTIKETFNTKLNDKNELNTIKNIFGISDSENCDANVTGDLNTIKETFDANFDSDRGDVFKKQTENCAAERIFWVTVFKNIKVSVVDLPWENVEENQVYRTIKPDLILAADVVYDNSVFKPLCSAVKYFLNFNNKCEVIFACTERNSDTLQEFLQLLESSELYINQLPSPNPDKFFWSTDVPIRFYKITAR